MTANYNIKHKDLDDDVDILNAKILSCIKRIAPTNPTNYLIELVRPYTIECINNSINKCKLCTISNCNKKSLIVGDDSSPILVIGEHLRQDQYDNDDRDYSFGSITDNIFFEALSELNINKDKLLYYNCINCFPNNNGIERLPKQAELENCYVTYMEDIITAISPKAILILGNIPLKLFSTDSLLAIRGQWFYINNIPAIATYSPSYFTKMKGIKDNDALKSDLTNFKSDMKILFDYIIENYTKEIINKL